MKEIKQARGDKVEAKQDRGDAEEKKRAKLIAKGNTTLGGSLYVKKANRGLSHEEMQTAPEGERAAVYDIAADDDEGAIQGAVLDGELVALDGLNDEQIEAIRKHEEIAKKEQDDRLNSLGESIAKSRAEAIAWRTKSGIEEQWREDEEFYEGIDDANRGESESNWSSKPVGQAMPDVEDTSSTIFLNITRPYCDAAGASLADMLLPTDDDGWGIAPTSVPELIPGIADGELPDHIGKEIDADAQMQGIDPEQIRSKVVDQAKRMMEENEVASERAKLTQDRIKDWHQECQYAGEVRRVIEDAARVGSGVIKGPFPVKRRQVAYKDGALIIQEEIKPASRRISYWNFYPMAGCGESIHDGSGVFERDDITSKRLRDLIGTPGYNEEQIKMCLEEGPCEAEKEFKTADDMKRRDTKELYEIWYFYGEIKKEDMEAAGCECEESTAPAQIVMVNNRVIKASLNPLDTGEFPYDVMVWQERAGMPWGMGVASQVRNPQRIINGATRNMMDNAGLAGGPMWAFKQGILSPIDGVAELAPRKGWMVDEDADIDAVQNAFTFFKMDIMVNELMAIINFGLKMAEDVTGLPAIMQGQMGSKNINTLGQTEILNNNANIVRRRIARSFDDRVTTPQLRRYHQFHLMYGPDEEKGEFVIRALGSSALVERAIQKEQITEVLSMAQNPVYGIDPKKAVKEFLSSLRFDPRAFEYDDDEWQKIVANLAQPQDAQDPRAEVAQLNAQVKQAIAQMETESRERIKGAELQAEERMQDKEHAFKAAMEQFDAAIQKEVQAGRYKGDKDLLLDKLKVDLNRDVMKLTTTKQLAGVKAPASQLPTPPVEPPQRAAPGQSFQQ